MGGARRRSTTGQWQKLGPVAREMRRESTPAEMALWQLVRGRAIGGAKFRRQHPVGPFVVDFICVQHGLVIEVDGGIHAEQVQRDHEREAYLEAAGLRVMRVTNDDVMHRPASVIAGIQAALDAAEP